MSVGPDAATGDIPAPALRRPLKTVWRIVKTQPRAVIGVIFDFFLEHPTFLQIGYRSTLDGDPRTIRDKRVSDRWLGMVEGTLEPAKARGEVKAIDPVHFMLTVDALVHWHILNDAVYRQHLGRGLEDPEIANQTREHVIRVALRTLGLD